MAFSSSILEPLASVLDRVLPDKDARDAARLELLRLESSRELDAIKLQMSAILAEAQSSDPWTSRARPSFLYVMYALLLWSVPMGLLSAVRPELARDVAAGMNAYLAGLPEPLYALFGTGYLGYTAARSWGKAKGTEK